MDDVIGSDSGSDIFLVLAIRELPANHRQLAPRHIRYRGCRHRQRRHHEEQGDRREGGSYYGRAAATVPRPVLCGASVRPCSRQKVVAALTNRDSGGVVGR
jgi:hypothetical protein